MIFITDYILIHDLSPLEILLWWKVGIIHHSRAEFLEEQTTKDSPSIHHLRDRGDIIVTNPLIIFQVIRDLLTKRKPLLVFDHTAQAESVTTSFVTQLLVRK